MILDRNQQSEAQLIGDIQNNKVGIDKDNLSFITSLLTTNLYSKPIQSFIRETVANGWDSHVEAGTTDSPVIIRTFEQNDDIHIAVRDYGTGLSPQRFEEIYCNIGSSTKRESNDYIGQFGLGRFSALAVSKTVILTNYYNGVCTKYLMYQDNDTICIDKLHEQETQESNGLEVEVTIDKSFSFYDICSNFSDALKGLCFYSNVYLDDAAGCCANSDMVDFNNRRNRDFETFRWSSLVSDRGIVMGNVYYPVDSQYFTEVFSDATFNFAIKIPIGELDVTPSREALLYSSKTKNNLTKRFLEAKQELIKILSDSKFTDFENIARYAEDMYRYYHNYTICDDPSCIVSLTNSSKAEYGLDRPCSIRGEFKIDFSVAELYHNCISRIEFTRPFFLYYYNNHTFNVKNCRRFTIDDLFYQKEKYGVYLTDAPLKPTAKRYFAEYISPHRPVYFFNTNGVKKAFYDACRSFKIYGKRAVNIPAAKFCFKEIIEEFKKCSTFNNSDVPQVDLGEQKLVKSTTPRTPARKCVIRTLEDSNVYDYSLDMKRATTRDTLLNINTVAEIQGTVFYSYPKDIGIKYLYYLHRKLCDFGRRNCFFIEVAKSNFKLFEDLENCINFSSIYTTKNSLVSSIVTYIYLYEKYHIQRNFNIDLILEGIASKKEITELTDHITSMRSFVHLLRSPESSPMYVFIKGLCTTYYKNKWLKYNIIALFEKYIHYLTSNTDTTARVSIPLIQLYSQLKEFHAGRNKILNYKLIKQSLNNIQNEYTSNTKLPHFDIR